MIGLLRAGFIMRKMVRLWPMATEILAAVYAARDPRTPMRAKAILLAALAYLFMPIDIIPDVLLGFGWLDDIAVLLAALKMAGPHITEEHRAKAQAGLGRMPFSRGRAQA
ncbi:YkvA family protein [Telmatospirillum sp. J64-1]|uniref:YkvA family protein n=1 Tax=Telmatospirillum sp. J64-1 TaxID=2502183 RepID=UPI001C8F3A4B|nr:YkvA family protein [Telmatospirillum sp. J64-1]